MAKSRNQKLKLLYILDYLQCYSDEEHPVTVGQIIAMLLENDIAAERKSVYNDIETLRLYGCEIISVKSKSTGYYVASREFELPELKLLVDSVQSSKFLTHKKSNELIKKLETLCSKYQASSLQRQVFVTGRVKTLNERIYYNTDTIHSAILNNKKISFLYFDYNIKKERVFRRDSKRYVTSPYALLYDDDNYYLIGYDDELGGKKHYRVDKATDIVIENEPRSGEKYFQEIDLGAYSDKMFSMFNGKYEKVQLEFDNSFVGVAIDRFGKDISLVPCGENRFSVLTEVCVSPKFFGWVFGLGEKVKITAPEYVVQGMKNYLSEIISLYK